MSDSKSRAWLGLALGIPAFAGMTAPGEPVQLDPVVVLGVPAPSPDLDVPAASSVVDAAQIRDGQFQLDLSESLARVPGIAVRNRHNYAQDLQVQSRGFGARASFGVRGLQLRIDDLPATAPDGQGATSGFLVGALERIEILRGPLAYPYGNSAGGVIAAYSEEPAAGLRARLDSGYASHSTWRIGGDVAGRALDDVLAYRLDAAHFSTGGARPHSAAERTQASGSLGLRFGESQSLRLVFNGVSQPDAQDPLGLTRAQFDADPHSTDPVALRFNTRKSVEERQAGVRWAFGSESSRFELMAYGSTRDVEQFLSIPVAVQAPATHAGGVVDLQREASGAEARYTWSGETASLSAGIQAQRADEDRRGYENFVGAELGVRGALRRDERNRLENVDPFVLAQWRPAPDWNLMAAARRSEVRFDSQDRFIRAGTPNLDDSGGARFHKTTPAIGAAWTVLPRTSLYASWGLGFETPTFNEIAYRPDGGAGLNLALRAAESRTVEVGWKHAATPGRRVTLALFETITQDEIVPAVNRAGRSTFQNADRTRRAGAELGVEARLAPDWSVQLAADWIDAQFRSPYTSIAAGTTSTVPAGNRIPGVARESFFGELAWRRGLRGISAAAELRASGKVAVNDTNSDAAASWAILNLRSVWRQALPWGEASVFVRVDNVFDRDYAGSVIVNEGNGRFFEPAPDRTFGGGLSLAFRS